MKGLRWRPQNGQTMAEYAIIIGIVTMVLFSMGPAIKRGVQTVIKGGADQLASQQEAEQDFSTDSSHLDKSISKTSANSQRLVRELIYTTTTTVNETAETTTSTMTNMGFMKK
jgi:Flp pilus assembly pilin Flp